jgi:hypothetical protein
MCSHKDCLIYFIFSLLIIQVCCEQDDIVFPEQVHISLADQPDSMTVQWVTMRPVKKDSFVIYGKDQNSLNLKQPARVDVFNFNNVIRYMYTAQMIDLDYNSTYCAFFT